MLYLMNKVEIHYWNLSSKLSIMFSLKFTFLSPTLPLLALSNAVQHISSTHSRALKCTVDGSLPFSSFTVFSA